MSSYRLAALLAASVLTLPFLGRTGLGQVGVVQTGVIAIRGARVIDGTGSAAKQETVIVRGSRIEAVGVGVAIPPGAQVIDATGETLLPGFIDLHTHLNSSAGPGALSPDVGKILKAYLAKGVTTVVDMSSYGEMFAPMRKLVADGTLPGPHIFFAARMSTPGGHGAESGYGEEITTEVSTVESVHRLMPGLLAYKPDGIKAFTDGWRYGTIPNLSSMNFETVNAIVSDAHAAGIRVLSHTVTLGGAKIAAHAGIDVIDHGVGDLPVDDELIGLLKAKGDHYGFTLSVYQPKNLEDTPPAAKAVLEPAILKLLSPTQLMRGERGEGSKDSQLKRFAMFEHNAATLHKAGIPLGDGTDSGMTGTFHGWATLHEMELLANDCGFTPMEALMAGTKVSADGLGYGNDRGTIAPGKLADLVLVAGSPDQDINSIEKTKMVFLAGKMFDPAVLEADIHSQEMTPLPVHKVAALVDDMERENKRTNLDTLRIETVDAGADHSRAIITRVVREGNNHAMQADVHFGPAEHPFVRLEVPVTRGAVELGDVSGYTGIVFDARGEGNYQLLLKTYAVRTRDWYAASFASPGAWRTIRLPFSAFKREAAGSQVWEGKDLRSLVFEVSGAPESTTSLQLDNVAFY